MCDGTTVWKNSNVRPDAIVQWEMSEHVAPQDLMSGDGLGNLPSAAHVAFASLLYPELSPKRGWGFTFESTLADAPGCVLVKRSARLTTPDPQIGHEWYYVDPEKGYAVVRAELFTLPPDTPTDPNASEVRQTIRMEGFLQTSKGAWCCTTIRDSTPGTLSNVEGPTGAAVRQFESTTRYDFDFDSDLPDSLFANPVE